MMRHFVPPRNNIVRYPFYSGNSNGILANQARNWPVSNLKIKPQRKLTDISTSSYATYDILDSGSPVSFSLRLSDLIESSYGSNAINKTRLSNSRALNLVISSYQDLYYLSEWAINDYTGIYSSVLPTYYDGNEYVTCRFEEFEGLSGNPIVLKFELGGNDMPTVQSDPYTDFGPIRKEFSLSAWHSGVIFTGMGIISGIYTYSGRYLVWPYEDGTTPGYIGEPLGFGWHHYVINYRQEQDEVVCHTYVDGVKINKEVGSMGAIGSSYNTIESLCPTGPTDNQSVFTLGGSGNPWEDTFVADIRLYNRCLSQGEVEDIYAFESDNTKYSPNRDEDWQTS